MGCESDGGSESPCRWLLNPNTFIHIWGGGLDLYSAPEAAQLFDVPQQGRGAPSSGSSSSSSSSNSSSSS
eukprot:4775296-Heterocapsa_arctica.AAC.1